MFSPAKINLGLQVHHKRQSDGYHYITSVFIPISFGDKLQVSKNKSSHQLKSQVNLPKKLAQMYAEVSEHGDFNRNLLYKVLNDSSNIFGEDFFLLHLQKNIPPGGGLGGGSSNAATLLKHLANQYNIDNAKLQAIALSTGADVPFFLQNQPCFVSGIGEVMQPLQVGNGFGVLCISSVIVNTGLAYQNLKRTLQPTPYPKSLRGLDSKALEALKNSEWSVLMGLQNDFEKPVFAMHSDLQRVKEEYYQNGAELAMMTGSGSTVYAIVNTMEESMNLVQKMGQIFPGFEFKSFEFPYNGKI